jgi:hypothetical protein
MKILLTAVAAASFAASAWGQMGDIRSVIEYRVKIDRAAEFGDLQKQFATELRKAGGTRNRYVFQLMSGPRAYVVVSYFKKWADLDQPPPPNPVLTGLLARINSCVESSERRIDVINPALSIRDTDAISNMVQVVRVSVRPERVNDYLALVKSATLPAYKKAGVKRRIFARVRFGGPSTDFVTSTGFEKWADLDGTSPLQKALGEQGYQDYLTKLSPLIYRSQFDVFRYLPDASYVPGSAVSSGN